MTSFLASELDDFDIGDVDIEDDLLNFDRKDSITKNTSRRSSPIKSKIKTSVKKSDSDRFFDDDLLNDVSKEFSSLDKSLKSKSRETSLEYDKVNNDKTEVSEQKFSRKSSVRFADKSDSLDFPNSQLTDGEKKSSLLNELFGKPPSSKSISMDLNDILSTSSALKKKDILDKPVLSKSEGHLPERRVGRRSTLKTSDPLGLFSNSQPDSLTVSKESTDLFGSRDDKKTLPERRRSIGRQSSTELNSGNNDLPDWLNGTDTKTKSLTSIGSKESGVEKIESKVSTTDVLLEKKNIDSSQSSQMISTENPEQMKKLEDRLKVLEKTSVVNSSAESLNKVLNDAKIKMSEMEYSHMENIVEMLKRNHTEQLEIMDTWYRKQISVLEETLVQLESRLKLDVELVENHYISKIDKLKLEIDNKEASYRDQLELLMVQHSKDIETHEERHKNVIKHLESDYISIINNIRRTKSVENEIVKETGSCTEMLQTILQKFETSTDSIYDIQSKLREQFNVQLEERERALRLKENELKILQTSLEHQREKNELEYLKLVTIIQSLENALKEQVAASKENKTDVKMQLDQLTAREAILEKDIQHSRDLAERERLQIQAMRETAITEYEKLSAKLTEERLSLSAEKAKHETLMKLNRDYSSEKSQAEVDAAVNAAREVIKAAQKDREMLLALQQKLDTEKYNIEARERDIRMRENELTATLRAVEEKKIESIQILNETKATEQKYNEQYRNIQAQMLNLRAREKKLMEDKLALSKERMSLHKSQTCALCAAENKSDVGKEEETNTDNGVSENVVELGPSSLLRSSVEIDLARFRHDMPTFSITDYRK